MEPQLLNIVDTAVSNINMDLQEDEKEDEIYLEIHTNGFCIVVKFLGEQIWSSENEDRNFDDDANEWEPLEPFLRKKCKDLIIKISKLQGVFND